MVHRREHLRQTRSMASVRAKIWSRLVRRLGVSEARVAKRKERAAREEQLARKRSRGARSRSLAAAADDDGDEDDDHDDSAIDPFRQHRALGGSGWVVPTTTSTAAKRSSSSAPRRAPIAMATRYPITEPTHTDPRRQKVVEFLWSAIDSGLRADGVALPAQLAAIVRAVEAALFERLATEVKKVTTRQQKTKKKKQPAAAPISATSGESTNVKAEATALGASPVAAPSLAPAPAPAPALAPREPSVAYRQQARFIASNLRDRKNAVVRQRVLTGGLSPSEIARATAADLANADITRLRDRAHALRATVTGVGDLSDTYRCEKCSCCETRVRQLISGNVSRKSEIWGASDAPTAVWQITCTKCHHTWRHEVFD